MKKFWKKPWISCLLALFLFAAGCSGQASARPQEPERETTSGQADDPAKGWNSTPRVLVPEASRYCPDGKFIHRNRCFQYFQGISDGPVCWKRGQSKIFYRDP